MSDFWAIKSCIALTFLWQVYYLGPVSHTFNLVDWESGDQIVNVLCDLAKDFTYICNPLKFFNNFKWSLQVVVGFHIPSRTPTNWDEHRLWMQIHRLIFRGVLGRSVLSEQLTPGHRQGCEHLLVRSYIRLLLTRFRNTLSKHNAHMEDYYSYQCNLKHYRTIDWHSSNSHFLAVICVHQRTFKHDAILFTSNFLSAGRLLHLVQNMHSTFLWKMG